MFFKPMLKEAVLFFLFFFFFLNTMLIHPDFDVEMC